MNDVQLFAKLEVKPPEELFMAPSVGYWQDVAARIKRNKPAMISFVIIMFIALAALIGPLLVRYTYDAQDLLNTYAKPSREHLFGTDQLGRDLFVRVLYGAHVVRLKKELFTALGIRYTEWDKGSTIYVQLSHGARKIVLEIQKGRKEIKVKSGGSYVSISPMPELQYPQVFVPLEPLYKLL